MSSVTNVNHDQAVDLAWIVALWTAIHRRDPASHEGLRIDVGATTALLGTLFLASLAETTETTRLTESELRDALRRIGVGIKEPGNACPEGWTSANVAYATPGPGGLITIESTGASLCLAPGVGSGNE